MASRKPAPKAPAAPITPEAEADKMTRFEVDGVGYEIDAANLTWGELEAVEDEFGKGLDDLSQTKSLIALVTLAMRRTKPETTWAEVRHLSIQAIKFDETEGRPTSAPVPVGSPS